MKVLVVDDSMTLRRILRRELEGAGYEVFEAADGDEAIAQWRDLEPDAITMDVDMPGRNGFETLTELRRIEEAEGRDPTPAVFITANDTVVDRERGFNAGASDFLVKPMPQGELARRVGAVLRDSVQETGPLALVAEDSIAARHVIVSALRQEGFRVLEAPDGQAAFDLAQAHQEEIDVVITDYVMPELNGDQLCRKLRAELELSQVPIIFLSAVSEKSFILEMFAAGGTDYLLKPFAKEELLARIRVHLEVASLNQRLQEQVEELERLNKDKDDFLAVTSHDLRSPLSSILGFTEMMLMDEARDPDELENLQYIHEAGVFLNSLVGDIHDLARLQAEEAKLDMQRVELGEVLDACLKGMRHMAGPKAIDLQSEVVFDNEGLWLTGDRNGLLRVLNNLVSNAIKFTPEQGRVRVEVDAGPEENQIAVRVIDTGIGIPEDKLPVLFDRFTNASRTGTAGERSTGLGMSITKGIVERHGGAIRVASTVGEGTTMTVLLPLLAE